jgi:hypothetical protein
MLIGVGGQREADGLQLELAHVSLGQQRWKMFVGVQDGKDEENPTKDRDTSAFTRPGIALANDSAIGNSLPSLKGQTSERSSFGKHRLHLNLRALMVLMPFLENPSYVAECRCMEEA